MKTKLLAAALALIATGASGFEADKATLREAEFLAMELARGNTSAIPPLLAATLLTGSPKSVAELQAQFGRDVVSARRVRAAAMRTEDAGTCTIAVPIVGESKTFDFVFVLKGCKFGPGNLLGYRLQPHNEGPTGLYERDEERIETPPYVDESALLRRPLDVETETGPRAAVLCIPRSATAKKRAPGVLLIGPPNAADIDGLAAGARPLRDIADALAANGVCVFRIATRAATLGEEGYASDAKFDESDVADARAALSAFAKVPEVDADRIYIGGLSSGCVVALRVAAKESLAHGLVLLGPPALFDASAELRGYEARTDISESERVLYRTAANAMEDHSSLDTQRFAGRPASWWDSASKLEPIDLAASFSGPAFFGFAEKDAIVPLADVERWRKALAKKKGAATGFYSGADSNFARAPLQAKGEAPRALFVAPEVLRDVLRFIFSGTSSPSRVTASERVERRMR